MLTIPQSSPCLCHIWGTRCRTPWGGEPGLCPAAWQKRRDAATRHGNHGKIHGKNGKIHVFFSKCFSMDFPTNKPIGFWFPPGKKPYGFSHCWTCFRLLPTKQKPIGFDLGTFPIRGFKSLKFLGAQIRFSGWKSGNYVDWPVAKWGDPPRAGSYEQLCTYISYNINIMCIYIYDYIWLICVLMLASYLLQSQCK